MVFVRNWNFDVAARLMTTIDLEQMSDPESDMGAALALVLESFAVSGNLPTGGATGTVLTKLSSANGDADWSAITMADIEDLAAELALYATVEQLNDLISTVGMKASQSSVDALSASLAAKASQSALDALSTTVDGKAGTAALEALTLGSLADVSALTPSDGNVVSWDLDTGEFVYTNLEGRYAAADPGTNQLLPIAAAPFTLFGFVIENGQNPPAGIEEILGLGVPIIGFEKPEVPTMIPVFLDDASGGVVTNVVMTMPEELAVGDKIGIAIGYSGEATLPDHFDISFSVGAGTVNQTTKNQNNATAGCVFAEVEITTTVTLGATITVTARNAANSAIQRTHFMAMSFRLPNTQTGSTAIDRQVNGNGNSSSTMTAIASGAVASDTVMATEVAIGIAAWNSGSGGTTRVLAGSNGWLAIPLAPNASNVKVDNGTTGRSLAVFYRELAVVGRPGLTTLMTASDSTTGQWSASTVTLKGA